MLSQTDQKTGKLNQLQTLLPEGLLAPTAWLEAHGYPRNLIAHYVKRGWLESPARGVYRRPGPPLKWQHVVISLQHPEFFDLAVHVGGLTALEMQGYGHFVRLGKSQTVHLYAAEKLPGWIRSIRLEDRFVAHRDRLFAPTAGGLTSGEIDHEGNQTRRNDPLRGLTLTEFRWGSWDWPMTYSTVERAILELLADVPKQESVEHANLLMQGMSTLSPRRLMRLLSDCRSVKVKRLFLALAERHGHAWFKELEVSKINLGRGKRVLVPGGHLHPKYLITLPPADPDDQPR